MAVALSGNRPTITVSVNDMASQPSSVSASGAARRSMGRNSWPISRVCSISMILNTTLGADGGCQHPALDAAECLLSFAFRLINDEWFRIRIIFKDGVIAGGYSCGVLHCSP